MRLVIHHPQATASLTHALADGLRTALSRLGHLVYLCADTNEVADCAPDLVLVVDPACPKLTDHFSIGFIWAPFAQVEHQTDWHGPITSWDLAVCACSLTRQFLRDIQRPARDASAVSDIAIYRYCQRPSRLWHPVRQHRGLARYLALQDARPRPGPVHASG